MNIKNVSCLFFTVMVCLFLNTACNNTPPPPAIEIVHSPEEMNIKTKKIIQTSLEFAVRNNGKIDDSIILQQPEVVKYLYEKKAFAARWSSKEQWQSQTDSLLDLIKNAKLYGLFPEDYHFAELMDIQARFINDSASGPDRNDAVLWSKADLMLTDAYAQIIKDIKLGRLPNDSITLRKDSVLSDYFYRKQFDALDTSESLTQIIQALEPKHKEYHILKAGIKNFLDSADYRSFTIVPPRSDTAAHKKALQRRLYEGGFIAYDSIPANSMDLAAAIKKFQKKKGITADGKAGEETIRMLNLSDREKFIRIAITMDRYKMLPAIMPSRYVWVNLPGYYMQLREEDSIKIFSKVICGKPATRTPVLTSAISELITYPQWTIPNSIIIKEILPAAKKDPGYFSSKGFSLVNNKGDEVDPFTVEWSKYNKGIPYKVVQGSGDDNALGILKFNFNNKYAVYLHDTNQRYLFGRTGRSLSHGCVRVQEWEKLAYTIIRYDSVAGKKFSAVKDSLNSWLTRKEKHSISVRNRLPVYIRYFTCEGKENGIVFYDDIYGEDKILREKYFAGK
jgi:murein L,D-transpeptidase YcbB/YkuD